MQANQFIANPFSSPWESDLRWMGNRFGQKTAINDPTGSISYEALSDRALALAERLRRSGVGPGTRTATLIRNSIEAVCCSFAIATTGSCEVTLNPAQSLDELAWCLETTNSRLLLHDGVSPLPAMSIPVLGHIDGLSGSSSLCQFHDVPVTGEETEWSRILFTSGTTGRPKGVVHSHKGRWLAAQLLRQALAGRMDSGSTLLITPFSHGSSLLTYALVPGGMPVHLLYGFDEAVVRDLITRGEVAHLFAPPAVLVRLVEAFRGATIQTIKTILTGTAPLPATLYRDVRAIFGPCIRITYGMTEIFNPITAVDPEEADKHYSESGETAVGIVGWPAPGVQLSIRDESGNGVPDGEVGEVFVHAQHMFIGYLQAKDRFEASPWFHPTGDLGCVDADRGLQLYGRLHDVIKTGGYKVNPQEVESLLREAGVRGEFVVVGLPSARWGEVIAFARAQVESAPFDDVRNANAALTSYKRPRVLVAVDAMPRSAIGKVDRGILRRAILERYELIDGAHPRLRARDGD